LIGVFAGVVERATIARKSGQGATAVNDRDIVAYEVTD
jgi:hypothetical protein